MLLFIAPEVVSTINVNVLSVSTVQITWLPVPQEEANGNITHYIVSVGLYGGRELYNGNISVSSDLQVMVNGFGECSFIYRFNLKLFLKLEKFLME